MGKFRTLLKLGAPPCVLMFAKKTQQPEPESIIDPTLALRLREEAVERAWDKIAARERELATEAGYIQERMGQLQQRAEILLRLKRMVDERIAEAKLSDSQVDRMTQACETAESESSIAVNGHATNLPASEQPDGEAVTDPQETVLFQKKRLNGHAAKSRSPDQPAATAVVEEEPKEPSPNAPVRVADGAEQAAPSSPLQQLRATIAACNQETSERAPRDDLTPLPYDPDRQPNYELRMRGLEPVVAETVHKMELALSQRQPNVHLNSECNGTSVLKADYLRLFVGLKDNASPEAKLIFGCDQTMEHVSAYVPAVFQETSLFFRKKLTIAVAEFEIHSAAGDPLATVRQMFWTSRADFRVIDAETNAELLAVRAASLNSRNKYVVLNSSTGDVCGELVRESFGWFEEAPWEIYDTTGATVGRMVIPKGHLRLRQEGNMVAAGKFALLTASLEIQFSPEKQNAIPNELRIGALVIAMALKHGLVS